MTTRDKIRDNVWANVGANVQGNVWANVGANVRTNIWDLIKQYDYNK